MFKKNYEYNCLSARTDETAKKMKQNVKLVLKKNKKNK